MKHYYFNYVDIMKKYLPKVTLLGDFYHESCKPKKAISRNALETYGVKGITSFIGIIDTSKERDGSEGMCFLEKGMFCSAVPNMYIEYCCEEDIELLLSEDMQEKICIEELKDMISEINKKNSCGYNTLKDIYFDVDVEEYIEVLEELNYLIEKHRDAIKNGDLSEVEASMYDLKFILYRAMDPFMLSLKKCIGKTFVYDVEFFQYCAFLGQIYTYSKNEDIEGLLESFSDNEIGKYLYTGIREFVVAMDNEFENSEEIYWNYMQEKIDCVEESEAYKKTQKIVAMLLDKVEKAYLKLNQISKIVDFD